MKKFATALLLTTVALTPHMAIAAIDPLLEHEPTFYILGGAGNASFDTKAKGVAPSGSSVASENNDSQASYKIAAGKLIRNGAFEVGYTDFGDSTDTGGTALSGFSFGVMILAPVGDTPFDFILRSDAYLMKHTYRGNEETTIPAFSLGLGSRLNWANGFFVQGQYDVIYLRDGIKGASGGEITTLIQHPTLQAGMAF